MVKKEIHTNGITGREDQEAVLPRDRLDSAVGITVFPDVVAGDRWAETLWTPAVFGPVDPPETCFILEHQSHFPTISTRILDFFLHFLHILVNFFEVSMTSSLAFLGCWLRGMTFRHPCRSSTR